MKKCTDRTVRISNSITIASLFVSAQCIGFLLTLLYSDSYLGQGIMQLSMLPFAICIMTVKTILPVRNPFTNKILTTTALFLSLALQSQAQYVTSAKYFNDVKLLKEKMYNDSITTAKRSAKLEAAVATLQAQATSFAADIAVLKSQPTISGLDKKYFDTTAGGVLTFKDSAINKRIDSASTELAIKSAALKNHTTLIENLNTDLSNIFITAEYLKAWAKKQDEIKRAISKTLLQ